MRKYLSMFVGVMALVVAVETFCPCDNHSVYADSTDVDFGVEVATRNMFRGAQAGDGPYVFPSLTIPLTNSVGGTTFNIYGQYAVAGHHLDENEIDFTLSQNLGGFATLHLSSYYYDGSLVDLDNHNLDLFLTSDYLGFDITLSRMIHSQSVEGDSYVEVGYTLDDFGLFVGAGDGSYSVDGGFAPVNVGFVYTPPPPTRGNGARAARWLFGYSAAFIYNPDTELPYFVVSKRW